MDDPLVLFPTTDTTVLTLTQIFPHLNRSRCVLPDPMTAETMVMKSKFYASLRDAALPHPQTYDPAETALETILQVLSPPVYLRPIQTLHFHRQFRGKGFVATTRHSVHEYLSLTRRYRIGMLVQEIIPGPTENGFIIKGYITSQGTPAVLFAVQKVLQPSQFANSSIIVTIPLSKLTEFLKPFLTYLRKQQYRGLFSAELKQDARDGQMKLLEVNARSTGDSYMGHACGADDIYAAYLDALGQNVPPQAPYQLEFAYINEFTSFKALLLQARAGGVSPHDLVWFFRPKHWRTIARADFRPVLTEVHRYLRLLRQLSMR
jgi:predicted ATP-grasp superfamily ATP-dependent carboligase